MKFNVREVATEATCKAAWRGTPGGKEFRCYLCGHRFVPGNGFRFVYGNGKGHGNFLTCDACDGPTVVERWQAAVDESRTRFWWLWADANKP